MQYSIFAKYSVRLTITISIVLQHLIKKHLFIHLFRIFHFFRIIHLFRISWFQYFDFLYVIIFLKQSFATSISNVFTNCMRNSQLIVDIVHDFYKFNKLKKCMSIKIIRLQNNKLWAMTLRKLSRSLLKMCKNHCKT